MDADVPKDSNMEATVICRTLDVGRELLALLGVDQLPESAIIQADNTTREMVNQFFACFTSILVGEGIFPAMHPERTHEGHTHNHVDQRFGTAAAVLKSAPVLEDPQDFTKYLAEHLTAVRGVLASIK